MPDRHFSRDDLGASLDALGATLPAPSPGSRYMDQVRHTRGRRRVRAIVGLAGSLAAVAIALALMAALTTTPLRPRAGESRPVAAGPAPNSGPIRAFDWRSRLRGGEWILPEPQAASALANPSIATLHARSHAEPELLRARDVQNVIDELEAKLR